MRSRLIASQVIYEWNTTGDFPDRLVPDGVPNHPHITNLVRETARRRGTLEFVLRRIMKRKASPRVRAALLVGACELLYIKGTAEYAATKCTVQAVKEFEPEAAGFVNAVLRSIQSNSKALLAEIESSSLALRQSHPPALINNWRAQFPEEVVEEICRIDNLVPESVLTILPYTDTEKAASLLARITEAGHPARIHPSEPGAIVVGHGVKIYQLPGYHEGDFIVQDPSPLTSIRLLDPKPGERILDACAAPGGKTLQIASLVGAEGHVTAADLHADRLTRLEKNLARVSIQDRVDIIECDAASAALIGKLGDCHFDAVLADVPCSNTGVLRRRADARWRFNAKRLEALQKSQYAILSNLALLNTGRIVYSTCSLERQEDEDVVEMFLASHPDWYLEDSHKLIPDDSPRDGAYAALLRRGKKTK